MAVYMSSFFYPTICLLNILAITAKPSNIKQPNFQEACIQVFSEHKYITFVQIGSGGSWGPTVGKNHSSLVKYKSAKTLWAILKGIVKIHSGAAQLLGLKCIFAVLAAWGVILKTYL